MPHNSVKNASEQAIGPSSAKIKKLTCTGQVGQQLWRSRKWPKNILLTREASTTEIKSLKLCTMEIGSDLHSERFLPPPLQFRRKMRGNKKTYISNFSLWSKKWIKREKLKNKKKNQKRRKEGRLAHHQVLLVHQDHHLHQNLKKASGGWSLNLKKERKMIFPKKLLIDVAIVGALELDIQDNSMIQINKLIDIYS